MATSSVIAALLAATIAAMPMTAARAKEPVPGWSMQQIGSTITQSIGRLSGIIEKAAKSPQVQFAGLLLRGGMAVKLYHVSKDVKGLKTDVATINEAVHGILSDIADLIERAEAGEVITAEQIAAANARIDVHALRLSSVEAEIEEIKKRQDEAERKQRDLDLRQLKSEREQREANRRQDEADRKQREIERRQIEEARKRLEIERRQAEQERRQKEDAHTNAAVRAKIIRPSREEFKFYDKKTGRTLDVRDRDNVQANGAKVVQSN